MSDQPRADPGDHVAVIAALGRLGMVGGWIVCAPGSIGGLDRADADLLLAAGMLDRSGADRFTVIDDDLVDLDGTTVGHAMVALLRRALEHTERRSAGWDGATADTVLSQGRGSRAVADHIARELLPRMPGSRAALESGRSRFLDVGVGVAAIAARLCQLYPGLTCVGIDVFPEVLRLAGPSSPGWAWLIGWSCGWSRSASCPTKRPSTWPGCRSPSFLAPRSRPASLVLPALRPDRWVVVPLATGAASDPFEMAVFAHTAHMLGGGPIRVDEAEDLLTAAGFDQITATSWRGQMLVLARRP